jgi:hypothetical protein
MQDELANCGSFTEILPDFSRFLKFCPTCQAETQHRLRAIGGAGSVRICVRCLERALQLEDEEVRAR